MSSTHRLMPARVGAGAAQIAHPGCGHKCGRKCGLQIHTSTAARPRQLWVFTNLPSPTTRPPRGNAEGWVRVVGLGVIWVRVQAGAGGSLWWDGSSRRVEVGSVDEEKTA